MTAKSFAVTDDQLLAYYDRFRELTSRVHRADRTSLLDLEQVNDSIQAIMEGRFGSTQVQSVAEVPAAPPTSKPQLIALSENGVEFDLTLDPATQGLALVTAFGYSGNWEFKGQPIAEPFTRRFKLEGVGYCRNLAEVATKCGKKGRVPEGSWLESFRKVFSNNDGKGPIGVADPSWVRPVGRVDFPMLDRYGHGWDPLFDDASGGRGDDWRWLVEVQALGKLEA